MGCRWLGAALQRGAWAGSKRGELPSGGLLPGVVQVPHNGRPIVLLADAQTTGGYPRIATVIEADLFHLAQIRLGEPIHFIHCTQAQAQKAAEEQRRYLEQLAWRLHDY